MKEIFSEKLHNKGIISIDYNKDTNEILTTAWDNKLKIYDLSSKQFIYNFSMKATIFEAKFLKDPFTIINSGRQIICLDSNEKISLLKLRKTSFITPFKQENNLFDISTFDDFGNIAVIDENNNINFSSLSNPKQIISFQCFETKADRRIKTFIYKKRLILLYRELQKNSFKIFNLDDRSLIFTTNDCLNYNNISIFENFVAGSTEKGEVDIWNVNSSEKIFSFKINEEVCSIFLLKNKLFLGLRSGSVIQVKLSNFTFKKIESLHQKRVNILIVKENKLFSASEDGFVKILELQDEEEEIFDYTEATEFIKEFSIHESYLDFFTKNRIDKIREIFNSISNYNPKKENVFKALEFDLNKASALILGQDPYPQNDVATGLSFEVGGLNSWLDTFSQSSLRNILRLLYRTYFKELKTVNEIRSEIKKGDFKILETNQIFKYWHQNGIILLNSILTCEVGIPGSHHDFWYDLVRDLLTYISLKNKTIGFIFWGKTAQSYIPFVFSENIIASNHPSRTNINSKEDFLNSNSFSFLKDKINLLGVENDIK